MLIDIGGFLVSPFFSVIFRRFWWSTYNWDQHSWTVHILSWTSWKSIQDEAFHSRIVFFMFLPCFVIAVAVFPNLFVSLFTHHHCCQHHHQQQHHNKCHQIQMVLSCWLSQRAQLHGGCFCGGGGPLVLHRSTKASGFWDGEEPAAIQAMQVCSEFITFGTCLVYFKVFETQNTPFYPTIQNKPQNWAVFWFIWIGFCIP